jgi:hypothetical protein
LEALERPFRHERLERVGDVRAMDEGEVAQHWREVAGLVVGVSA